MGRAADAEVTFVADDAAPLAIAFRRAAVSRAARALPPSAPNSAAALLTLSPWPLRLGTGGVCGSSLAVSAGVDTSEGIPMRSRATVRTQPQRLRRNPCGC